MINDLFVYKRVKFPILFALAFIILTSSVSAFAFRDDDYTTTEKVAFAYYKLAGMQYPNFEKFIKSGENYRNTLASQKNNFLKDEKIRLEQGFINYYPEYGMIDIQSDIVAKGYNAKELEQAEIDEKFFISLSMTDDSEDMYFPYYIGDRWIAFIPHNAGSLQQLPLTKEQYEFWDKALKFKGKPKRPVTIRIKIQPVSVDNSAPLTLNDNEMWLMMGEIASMDIWKDYGKPTQMLLYEYTAPWYVSKDQQELMLLYQK